MKTFTNLMLVPMAIAAAMAAAACDSAGDDGGDGGDDTGGSGGSSGSGTGGSSGTGTGNTVIIPSTDGWVDRMDVGNDVGVQGAWYPYGDQYGTGGGAKKCLLVGMHTPEECSRIDTPDPTMMAFPNTGGNMCTSGSVAQVLDCPSGLMTSGCPNDDFSNMWGAGIGWDLNAEGGSPTAPKHPWNPADYGVIGFEFTIDAVPLPGLRVEIPMVLTDAEATMVMLPAGSTTDDHPDGAPYWGAMGSGMYPKSPVVAGVNRVLWTDIQPPRMGNYVFDTTRMLGIQFHVPANNMSRGDYEFCISQVTFIRG